MNIAHYVYAGLVGGCLGWREGGWLWLQVAAAAAAAAAVGLLVTVYLSLSIYGMMPSLASGRHDHITFLMCM